MTNKSDRLLEHYNLIAPLLLSRFKEREESVKIDIFRAYESLLKQTRLFLPDSLSNLDTAMFNAAVSLFNIGLRSIHHILFSSIWKAAREPCFRTKISKKSLPRT